MIPVLNQANFMGLAACTLIVEIPYKGLKEGPMCRRSVALKLGPKHLLLHKCIW